MISHHEAEVLISARLDQRLDPLTERELAAHLATCPRCRAFARATSALASGLRELPSLPASPAVSRGVRARIEEGRSPWLNLGGPWTNPGPALSTLAIIAVVLLLGFFVLNRFVLDGRHTPDQEHQQLASQPTVPPQTPRNFVLPGTPEPTATSEPEATETPTIPPEPTETQAPEPTATSEPEPTATTPPEPTATEPPAVARAAIEATSEPVDLTGAAAETPEATATEAASPQPSPTVTPEPTAADPPAETPAPEPTSTPEPSTPTPSDESPPIEPIAGGEVVQAPEDEEAAPTATSEPAADEEPGEEEVPIQQIGDGTGNERIEPINGTVVDETPVAATETPEATAEEATRPSGSAAAIDLGAHSVPYGGIAGDPSGRLALDGGRMEFWPQAHPALLTSGSGIRAETTSTDNGQAVTLCANDECVDVTSASADGPATDTPLSWVNGALIYVRDRGEYFTYHALVPDSSGTAVQDDSILYDGGSALAPTFPVYWAEGRVWVITEGGTWLAFTEETAKGYENSYSSPKLLRFAPSDEGELVAYVADGQVIVAATDAPGSPIGRAPFAGVDFDVSPGARRIVVSTGAAIEIYDLDGTLQTTYASPDMQPGTVLWLDSGIVFQDEASGVLMEIPDPQAG